jgi:hypothetical protein
MTARLNLLLLIMFVTLGGCQNPARISAASTVQASDAR